MVGLSAVADRGLVFGKDVIFSYGPLGYATLPLAHSGGGEYEQMFTLLVFLSYWFIVVVATCATRDPVKWSLVVAAAAACALINGSVIGNLANVMIVTNVGFLVVALRSGRPGWSVPAVIVGAAALLVKFNVATACLATMLVYSGLLLFRERRSVALPWIASLAVAFCASTAILYAISSNSIRHLSAYLKDSLLVAGGYSSQMSVYHPWERRLMAGAIALAVLVVVALMRRSTRKGLSGILILILPALFVAFKSGIVRSDLFHLETSFATMAGLIAFLLLAEVGRRGQMLISAILSATMTLALSLYSSAAPIPGGTPGDPFLDGPRHMLQWLGTWNRYHSSMAAPRTESESRQMLPASIRARIDREAVDSYPSEIALLLASGLNWSPRYTLQSYVAFHPILDYRCSKHYSGPGAPRFIVYQHQAIDGQHPCWVDPQTWLEIYRWYDVAESVEDTLLLERRGSPRVGNPVELGGGSVAFGQRLEVPSSGPGVVILRARILETPLGSLRDKLYKLYPPDVQVEFEDGAVETYRLVWRNTVGGLVLSNLPRDLGHAMSFFQGSDVDRVKSVKFLGNTRDFVKNIEYTWYSLPHG
jgi:hypothetical protein